MIEWKCMAEEIARRGKSSLEGFESREDLGRPGWCLNKFGRF